MTGAGEGRADLETLVSVALGHDDRRVVVFDDDPTGTQTVSGVTVLLDARPELLNAFFSSGQRALWILTNTRALPREEAVQRLRALWASTDAAARRTRSPWFGILRGDSTLRGHVFAEIDAVASVGSATLFVPAFPEGGRVTRQGQHWLRIDGTWQNVADTEFAKDPFFGYRSRLLVDWVCEVGDGRDAQVISLEDQRRNGPAAISDALLGIAPGGVVIPEVETPDDVRRAVLGLIDAERRGRPITVRSAATFAAARTGLRARSVDARVINTMGIPREANVLVACGSHTSGSGRQLAALESHGVDIAVLEDDRRDGDAVRRTAASLREHGLAGIATPRRYVPGTDFEGGAAWMRRLASAVATLAHDADVVVAKGGITSAELARALGADAATVEGQLDPGIALWTLEREPRLPYVVVPGNVGDANALVRVVGAFRTTFAAEPARTA